MDKDTEKMLLIGGAALAVYILFIKKPTTTPVITTSSTGVTAIPNGTNLLSAASAPLSSLTSALSNLFNKAPAPPAGGTQGANAVQLVSADPIATTLPPLTTTNILAQTDASNPFAAPGALVVPGFAQTAIPVSVDLSTVPADVPAQYAYQPDYSSIFGDGSDAFLSSDLMETFN